MEWRSDQCTPGFPLSKGMPITVDDMITKIKAFVSPPAVTKDVL